MRNAPRANWGTSSSNLWPDARGIKQMRYLDNLTWLSMDIWPKKHNLCHFSHVTKLKEKKNSNPISRISFLIYVCDCIIPTTKKLNITVHCTWNLVFQISWEKSCTCGLFLFPMLLLEYWGKLFDTNLLSTQLSLSPDVIYIARLILTSQTSISRSNCIVPPHSINVLLPLFTNIRWGYRPLSLWWLR